MRADSPQVPSCRHGFAVWLQNCLKMRKDCPAHRETVSTVSTQITWMPGLMTPSSLRQRCLADNVVKPLSMLPGRQASVSVAWPTSCQTPAKVAWPTGCCGTRVAPSLRHENMTAENGSQIPKTSLQHSTVVGFCQLSLPEA